MSSALMPKQSPFKATRLWNQLLISFKEGMQLKRKRYRLKSYQQCFSGSEALEWLHKYLQNHPSFGEHVMREQAFMLLQKFLDNNVFESAVGKKNKKFYDTNYLYKFVVQTEALEENEEKENIPSQKSLTNLLKNVGKRNSTSVEDTSDSVVKSNNRSHLVSPIIENLKCIELRASTDEHNISQMNMAMLYDPEDEDDLNVFDSSIAETFNRSASLRVKNSSMYSGAGAISRHLLVKRGGTKPSTKIIDQRKNEKRNVFKKKISQMDAVVASSSLGKRPSLEVTDTVSPSKKRKLYKPNESNRMLERQCGKSLLSRKAVTVLGEKPSFINQVNAANTHDVSVNKVPNAKNSNILLSEIKHTAGSYDGPYFKSKLKGYTFCENETNFLECEATSSPKRQKFTQRTFSPHPMRRRSLSHSELLISKCRSVFNINEKSGKKTTENFNDESLNFSNVKKSKYLCKAASTWTLDRIGLSQDNTCNQHTQNEITAQELDETWKSVALLSLRKILNVERIGDYVDCDLIEGNSIMRNMECSSSEFSKDAPDWLVYAMSCLEEWPSQVTHGSLELDLPNYPGFERDVYRAVKEHYYSTLKEPLICCHLYAVLEECVEMSHNDSQLSVRLLQHLLLLLPCWNRRQLQLLMRFIRNISNNTELTIGKDLPNRDLAIHSFFRIIARKEKHTLTTPYNEGIAIRIVGFLIDNYEEIFKSPQGLRVQVDHKLAVVHGSVKLQNTLMSDDRPSSAEEGNRQKRYYCKQITKQEYEKEAIDFSNNAIKDLLQSILDEPSLNVKERAKRLKQFEIAYPDIYAQKVSQDRGNISVCSESQRATRFKLARKPSFPR